MKFQGKVTEIRLGTSLFQWCFNSDAMTFRAVNLTDIIRQVMPLKYF